ncbi:5-dehydro-2-deoxygluconokinase [Streptomyces canus]
MVEPVQQFDVISMGRIGVDLHPLQPGLPLAQVLSFGRSLGGSAANVVVAAARLGHSAAVVARTGADPFAAYLHQTLTDHGVDDRWVTAVESQPTPVTFCESAAPDDLALYSYRRPTASELEIHTDELDCFALRAARVLWLTGSALDEEPSRSATLAALRCRGGAATTVLDLDRRPALRDGTAAWADPDEARPHHAEALRHATVVVGDLDECARATGLREPRACAQALLAAGVHLAVVRLGPKGVLAVHRDGTTAEVPPVPGAVTGGPGPAHAFGGALCHGLLSGWDPERTVRFATAAAAHVAAHPAGSSAMPTQAEVEDLLNGVTT